MHMWGKLFPKRGQLEWPCSVVNKDFCDLLALEDDHDVLDLVLNPYVGMDWRGCANTQYTQDEQQDDRGNIILMFLIYLVAYCSLLFNAYVIYCNFLLKLSDYYCLLFCIY